MDSEKPQEIIRERLYDPPPGESQLTVRAVLAGCVLGGIVVAMNLYLGLRIGWTEGGSLMAAILGVGLFAAIRPRKKYSILEANITQTSGSGAGVMASAGGLVAPIPALTMLGYEMPVWALFVWTASIAYLGVMFAVPLRRQYVVIEKLRFPTGTATANTIMAMFATAAEAVAKAKVLLYFGVFALGFICFSHFTHFYFDWAEIEHPPLDAWTGSALLASLTAWGFSLYLGPFTFGAGLLIGPRVGSSLAAGAVVGFGVLGVIAFYQGWAPHENPMTIQSGGVWGPRGWILWPGVAIMVADALTSLALSWRTFVTAFKGTKSALATGDEPDDVTQDETIPNSWWTIGLAIASVGTIVIAWIVFDIPPYLSVIAILLSAILANVAVRSTGETDINPVGGMGKVTQAAFGALSDSMSTNLLAAGISGAGASQAGDMMHDLKTGYLLGASPRKQFKAQLFGIASGVIFAVPIYLLYDEVYDIGGEQLGAPAALAWKAVAEVLSKGFDALPPHATLAVLGGLIFGALIPLTRKFIPRVSRFMPNGLAFGIAFIVHPYYSIAMFLGSMGLVAWRTGNREQCERFVFAVACGLIAGQGIGGFVNAMHMFIAGNF